MKERLATEFSAPAQAVALAYDSIDQVPTVLARGVGELAKQIIDLAKQHKVPIEKDLELVEMLSSVPVGQGISPESFKLVAEIICFLYQTDKEWRAEHPGLKHLYERPN